MAIKDFFSFRKNRFFWVNIILMIAVVCSLIYGILAGLDKYTRHGHSVEVPDIKGLSVEEANSVLGKRGLTSVVIDSTYVKDAAPGRILEQNPARGLRVKDGRAIYLTISSLSIPLRSVPDVADNSSLRQAQAKLTAAGFKLTAEEYINGERDWVYGVKYKGRQLTIGEKIPTGATLTLLVGDGSRDNSLDSTFEEITTTPQESEKAAVDDSWF